MPNQVKFLKNTTWSINHKHVQFPEGHVEDISPIMVNEKIAKEMVDAQYAEYVGVSSKKNEAPAVESPTKEDLVEENKSIESVEENKTVKKRARKKK